MNPIAIAALILGPAPCRLVVWVLLRLVGDQKTMKLSNPR